MIDENELLEGQRNIFEVIADFESIPEKKPKKKRVRAKDMSGVVPTPIKTSEWLELRVKGLG